MNDQLDNFYGLIGLNGAFKESINQNTFKTRG